MAMRGRLLPAGRAPKSGERFQRLATLHGTTVEHILSSAQPDGRWYDQAHDEWVIVLGGEATVEVEAEPEPEAVAEMVRMVPGDWLLLRAHTRHRIVAADAGTSWLAVHGATPGC